MSAARPYIGTLPSPADCCVPKDCYVVEMHGCENCTRVFLRRRAPLRVLVLRIDGIDTHVFRDTGERFCGPCKSRMLLPEPQEEDLKETFPSEFGGRRGQFVVHYDDSLAPKPKSHIKSHNRIRLPRFKQA